MRSPMSFFDTNPTGRILNRFSADIDKIDLTIPFIISDFLWCTCEVIGKTYSCEYHHLIIPINFDFYHYSGIDCHQLLNPRISVRDHTTFHRLFPCPKILHKIFTATEEAGID